MHIEPTQHPNRRDTQHYYSDLPTNSSSQTTQKSKPVEYDSGSAARKDAIPSVRKATVVVVGCAAVDITSQAEVLIKSDQKSTYPGKVSVSLGGVARNIAEATHRVMSGSTESDAATLLVAPIGDDDFGKLIGAGIQSLGMRTDGLMSVLGRQSSVCNLLLDSHGELQCGVSDMDLPHAWKADQVGMASTEHSWFAIETSQILATLRDQRPQLLALDGNISSDVLTTLVTESLTMNIQSTLV